MKYFALLFIGLLFVALGFVGLVAGVLTSPVWGIVLIVNRIYDYREYKHHGWKKDVIENAQKGGSNLFKSVFDIYTKFNTQKSV